MRGGQLRHKVTIQSQTTAQDSYGAAVRTWADVATVWAGIDPIAGRELWAVQQTQATTTHRITMRYRGDVTPSCRLTLDVRNADGVVTSTRIFGVDSVINPEELGERLVVLCTEGIGDGG